MAARRSLSMQTRKAARVLPEPVGAEIRVGSPRRIAGQPAVCGSVAEPNFARNHSCTTGCAQARAVSVAGSRSASMSDCSASPTLRLGGRPERPPN